MSTSYDSAYVNLGIAIIEQAERDYSLSAQRLLNKHYSRRWQYDGDVNAFKGCMVFFLNGCNELVGEHGEETLAMINKRNGIDQNAVIQRIKRGYENH